MNQVERKNHWEKIYETKGQQEVSWYQNIPLTSLEFFDECKVPLEAKIIDIGGGDSFLVDHLLDRGYKHVSVLDISSTAIEKAKLRLGNRATLVNWIVADIANYQPKEIMIFGMIERPFIFLQMRMKLSII